MFYLTHKTIDDIQEGDKVLVLSDFPGIPAGTKGVIIENYTSGVTVEWALEEDVNIFNVAGEKNPKITQAHTFARRRVDGFSVNELGYFSVNELGYFSVNELGYFSVNELGYLAFATEKHPFKSA